MFCCTKIFQADFVKLFDVIGDIRKNLDCDNLIDSFEKRWSEWDINDTIEWLNLC